MEVNWKNHESHIKSLVTKTGESIAGEFDENDKRLKGGLAFTPWQCLCVIHECVLLTNHLPGAVCECGVARGGSAFVIATAAAQDKNIHLFDSFEGLSTPVENDRVTDPDNVKYGTFHCREGTFGFGIPEFFDTTMFNEFDGRVIIHKGWVADTLNQVDGKKFSYIYVDCDIYEPTRDIINALYPKLVPGGIMSFDDVILSETPGVRIALEEYFGDIESLDHYRYGSSIFIRKPLNE